MDNYFETLNKKDCNGCRACSLRCPKGAIKMVEDEEGFLYPQIDKDKCINCGLCRRICSNNPKENEYNSKVYAAINKNDDERKCSTSGGMFKPIATTIINKVGVVFGVKYNENLEVEHSYTDTIEGCKEFSISKYVRSNLKDSYQNVEKFLKEDRYVLFTGTPCQCYGLRKYLRKDYEKLLLVEIMCHSNPSPKVFKMYKENIEKENNKKIKYYYFRNKDKKPYALFEDGTTKEYNIFNTTFNKMIISRPSCSNCKFSGLNRKADITIGDFWGIEHYFPDMQDNKGISLLCVNSEKGEKYFEEIRDKIIYKESNLEDGFRYNHNCNLEESKYREKFFKGIKKGNINNKNIIKYMKKYTKVPLYTKVINKIKKLIKKVLKWVISIKQWMLMKL